MFAKKRMQDNSVKVCVADDMMLNCKRLQYHLSIIDTPLQVSLMHSAEDVAHRWIDFSILVLDNDFGTNMTGSQLIQLIRNAENEDEKKKFIILWSADDDLENPGADLMWKKGISFNDVKADMLQALDAM